MAYSAGLYYADKSYQKGVLTLNKRVKGQGGFKLLIKYGLEGVALSMVLTLALLFIVALAVSTGAASEKLADSLMITALILATTAGGVYCASKRGEGVITAGAVCSGLYIIAAIFLGMLLPKQGQDGGMLLRVIIASVAGGTFGGVLKLNRKNKKSRLRK